jgi:topoisomerase-4 subunit B
VGPKFKEEDLRYERVIIMTDADVDGAHIASLLITFFYRSLPGLVRAGRLYMALPPLYRLTAAAHGVRPRRRAPRELVRTVFKGKKPEIGRFKGLGEMMPAQLKETTMDPKKRILARVTCPRTRSMWRRFVETLMGRKPEHPLQFIQENAQFVHDELDV